MYTDRNLSECTIPRFLKSVAVALPFELLALNAIIARTKPYFLTDQLSPEHDHGLLADIVWVLGHDEVDVLLLDPQLPAQAHPVPAQQVGDVGDAQVSPVDGVKLPVARLTQEAVLGLQKKRVGIRLTHVELLTRQIGVQVDDWEGSRLQCCGPGLFFARTG